MKKSTILGMKITKNVILCSKLIANLPSYHVYLILYTKKISGWWKFWRVLWWIFLWPNRHQIGITFKIMGIECLYNAIGSICIFNFVHSGKSFPKITKPYKIYFSQTFWVQFKKNISAHYILDNVAHILLLCWNLVCHFVHCDHWSG